MQTVLILVLRSVLMVNVSPKSVQRMNLVELSEIIRLAAPKTILLGIGIISLQLFQTSRMISVELPKQRYSIQRLWSFWLGFS
jgi:hypothetical protein